MEPIDPQTLITQAAMFIIGLIIRWFEIKHIGKTGRPFL